MGQPDGSLAKNAGKAAVDVRLLPHIGGLEQVAANFRGRAGRHLLDPDHLAEAAAECEVFYGFLTELFDQISKRAELTGVAFDRPAAALTLDESVAASDNPFVLRLFDKVVKAPEEPAAP